MSTLCRKPRYFFLSFCSCRAKKLGAERNSPNFFCILPNLSKHFFHGKLPKGEFSNDLNFFLTNHFLACLWPLYAYGH